MRNILIALVGCLLVASLALMPAGEAAFRSRRKEKTTPMAVKAPANKDQSTGSPSNKDSSKQSPAKPAESTSAASTSSGGVVLAKELEAAPKADAGKPKADVAKSPADPAKSTSDTAKTAAAPAAADTAPPPPHLMAESKAARLRKLLPRVDNPELQKILQDPRLILYTEQEMPRAYQEWSGSLQGVHSAYYNISANGSEPYGNGNREFPWGGPAGTQRTKDVEAFRFVWLPRDATDHPRPVVWFRKRLKGDTSDGYAWTFPVGAVVGEALTMTGPDGYAYTFEIRTRKREYGYWDMDVLRPFPTAGALAERIKQLRPDWQNQTNLVAAIDHLEKPVEMKVQTLADKQPAKRVFKETMGVDTLPSLGDDKLVGQLLAGTVFRSAGAEAWRESPSGVKTYAPTTTAAFHIVPANYDAGFVQVDTSSCMRCHETASKPVTDFNPGRDWYGHIRGSDGILSFHPFAPETVSGNGFGNGVKMRSEFEKTGVIAKYDPTQHPAKFYQTLEVLQK